MISTVRAVAFATALVAASAPLTSAQTSVTFPSNDGDLTDGRSTKLTGLLYQPSGGGRAPAIVLMHGCGGLYTSSGRLAARHEDWARRFQGLGYVALLVDSFTPRGLSEICTVKDRPLQPGRERVRDAYGALLYLQGLGAVRGDRVGLMGWSHGGSTTVWTVATTASGRPPKLAHDFRAAVAFYPGCRPQLQSRTWTTRIPLDILIGAKDNWTPAPPCVDLAERARAQGDPVAIVTYPNAFHDFDAPNIPLRTRTGLATVPGGSATVGTDPDARADAIKRVPAFFARHLAGR
ncbi:MAG TPA: dienelactone hydrolase family protein [Methylomirabilota bacterium]